MNEFPPTLTTDRLILRPYELSDAADVFEYASDAETVRYMSFDRHTSIYDAINFLSMMRARYAGRLSYDYAIALKEQNKMIGGGGVFDASKLPHLCDIGYIINKKYHGMGYAAEAMGAVISLMFEGLGVHKIQGRHFAENLRSGRVMQKLGMQYEGELKGAEFVRGEYRDVRYYGLINPKHKPE
ncbi:MAG: GNAT family N-acetyltransferase [Clostridiales bacterium]|jgi:ribosomal-protein-alanine N-acetyltransferase|nr:GNAT family N-acetyltransferase [Clostridiales bacterium]